MATTIPKVSVTRPEDSDRFLIGCTSCGHVTSRITRLAADLAAGDHQRSHVAQNPADQDRSF